MRAAVRRAFSSETAQMLARSRKPIRKPGKNKEPCAFPPHATQVDPINADSNICAASNGFEKELHWSQSYGEMGAGSGHKAGTTYLSPQCRDPHVDLFLVIDLVFVPPPCAHDKPPHRSVSLNPPGSAHKYHKEKEKVSSVAPNPHTLWFVLLYEPHIMRKSAV